MASASARTLIASTAVSLSSYSNISYTPCKAVVDVISEPNFNLMWRTVNTVGVNVGGDGDGMKEGDCRGDPNM